MKIDISRVNLLEKDIEDWLYANPQSLDQSYEENPIVNWIGRQYQLPSGIADLIGVRQDRKVVVVEVKNVPINKAAVLQVCRYTDDVKHILTSRMDYPHIHNWNEPAVEMVLVGPSIDDQTFMEACAVNVQTFVFSAQLTLDIGPMQWTSDYRNKVSDQVDEIATRHEWGIFGMTIREHIKLSYADVQDESDYEAYSDIILGDGADEEEE